MNLPERAITIAALCVLLTLVFVGASKAQTPHEPTGRTETIWTGKSSAYRWRWTTSDLFAMDLSSRRVFSAAAKEKAQRKKENTEEPMENFYLECTIKPLSLVDSIVSYERDYYWSGGAHPSGATDYVSVDITRPQHKLLLTDLFPDAVVLNALLEDKIVRDTLQRNNLTARPRTSAELVNLLKDKTFGGDNGTEFGFSENLLERFAFHHIENGKIAVRLNISWGSEIYRFTSTQIGLLLPLPAKLSVPFRLASSGQQGFLMRESKKLSHGKTTLLFTEGKEQR